MGKEKACRQCKAVYEGAKCPQCGSTESLDTFKGKVAVINPELSEIAQKLQIKQKGVFAIKLK